MLIDHPHLIFQWILSIPLKWAEIITTISSKECNRTRGIVCNFCPKRVISTVSVIHTGQSGYFWIYFHTTTLLFWNYRQ